VNWLLSAAIIAITLIAMSFGPRVPRRLITIESPGNGFVGLWAASKPRRIQQ
jgi:hypothetical protein